MGIIHTRKGDYTQAVRQFSDAQTLYKGLQHDKGLAQVHNGLGIVAATEGRYEEAEQFYGRALTVYRQLGYQRGVANILSNIGSVYGRREAFATAQRYYEEAYVASQAVDERMVTAAILSNLGSVSCGLEAYDAAVRYYEESLPITQELGELRWVAANHNGLGFTYLNMQAYAQAAAQLKQGFETAISIQAIPDALTALTHLGRIAAELKQHELAARWLIFVVNHTVTPAVSRQEAQTALIELGAQLTPQQREMSRTATLKWTINDVQQTVRNWVTNQ